MTKNNKFYVTMLFTPSRPIAETHSIKLEFKALRMETNDGQLRAYMPNYMVKHLRAPERIHDVASSLVKYENEQLSIAICSGVSLHRYISALSDANVYIECVARKMQLSDVSCLYGG